MAFKIDFSKLMDPEHQAKVRREQEAAAAAAQALEEKHRSWLRVLVDKDEQLSSRERSFIRSCEYRLNTGVPLSEPQEKWLCDLAARFSSSETRHED